jgi:hypothetical protein
MCAPHFAIDRRSSRSLAKLNSAASLGWFTSWLALLARDAVSAARNAGHLASPVWEISEDATMPGRIYSIAPAVSMCQCTSLPARQIGAALSTDRPTTADTPGGRHVRQEIGQNQSLFGSKGISIH